MDFIDLIKIPQSYFAVNQSKISNQLNIQIFI